MFQTPTLTIPFPLNLSIDAVIPRTFSCRGIKEQMNYSSSGLYRDPPGNSFLALQSMSALWYRVSNVSSGEQVEAIPKVKLVFTLSPSAKEK